MTGYIRKDITNSIANGEVIDADVFDLEFDGIVTAFNSTTGHTHGGGVGEGAPITVVGPTQDLLFTSSLVRPKSTATVDLGSSSFRFKDLYLSGAIKVTDPSLSRTELGLGTASIVNTGTGSGDVPTISQADARYVNVAGDTMTGSLNVNGSLGVTGDVGGNGFYLNVGNAGYYWDGSSIIHSFDNGDFFYWTPASNVGGFSLGSTVYQMTTTGGLDSDQDVVRRVTGDARYARLAAPSTTFTNGVTASGFTLTDGLNYFGAGRAQLRGASPTLDLRDQDELGAAIHVNSNNFFIMRALTDSNTWEQVGGRWPLQIDLSSLAAVFGGSGNFAGNVTAPSFTGNGAGVTNVNAASLQGATINTAALANTIAQRDADADLTMRYALTEFVSMNHAASGATTDTIFYSSTDNFVRKNTAAGMRASLGISSTAEANALYVNVGGDTMSGGLTAPSFSLSVGDSNYRWDGSSIILDLDAGDYMFFTRSTNTGGFQIGSAIYTMDASGGATSGASILRKATADTLYALKSEIGAVPSTSRDEINFPVGAIIVARYNPLSTPAAGDIERNDVVPVYLMSTDARFYTVITTAGENGTQLTGTWRSRGVIVDDASIWSVMLQRTA